MKSWLASTVVIRGGSRGVVDFRTVQDWRGVRPLRQVVEIGLRPLVPPDIFAGRVFGARGGQHSVEHQRTAIERDQSEVVRRGVDVVDGDRFYVALAAIFHRLAFE